MKRKVRIAGMALFALCIAWWALTASKEDPRKAETVSATEDAVPPVVLPPQEEPQLEYATIPSEPAATEEPRTDPPGIDTPSLEEATQEILSPPVEEVPKISVPIVPPQPTPLPKNYPKDYKVLPDGRLVCSKKHDVPSKSKKHKKGHMDMECCLDPDEVKNPHCWYDPKIYGKYL